MGGRSRCYPRQSRLLKPAEFRRVFAGACKVGNAHLTILARPNDMGRPRLGLAIAKKHVKRAVGRNRIKRQVRESFRLYQHEIGGLDIVVLARRGIERVSPQEIRRALDGLWQVLATRCDDSSSC